MNHFSELSLCSALQSNLTKHKFLKPTPVQAGAIPPALEGRDVVATAQTGTGKTLGFALPLIQRLGSESNRTGIKAVVLSPTRELAIQIGETFSKLLPGTGLRTATVVGGMNENTQLKSVKAGAQIIIATPGRLCDFLQRKLVRLGNVSIVVLDEADRMLDMGFLPSLKAILQDVPTTRQTLLFSATIEKSVAHLISAYTTDPVRVAIGATTKPAEQVDLHHYEVEQDRKLSLLRHLLAQDSQGAFLVFARTKHGADRLARKLTGNGVNASRIHGNRTQAQRNQALEGFRNGKYRVLVATDVAARGIHVDGIAHVVNYDLPQVPEDFIHRAGRTGRAGAKGIASTFSTRGERGDIHRIERALNVRMNAREVPSGLPREERNTPVQEHSTKVVVIPSRTNRPGHSSRHSATGRGRRSR